MFDPSSQRAFVIRIGPKSFSITEDLKSRPGDTQFSGEEAIQPHACTQRNDQLNFESLPVSTVLAQGTFMNVNVSKLVDTVSIASQRIDVECFGSYPFRIVRS